MEQAFFTPTLPISELYDKFPYLISCKKFFLWVLFLLLCPKCKCRPCRLLVKEIIPYRLPRRTQFSHRRRSPRLLFQRFLLLLFTSAGFLLPPASWTCRGSGTWGVWSCWGVRVTLIVGSAALYWLQASFVVFWGVTFRRFIFSPVSTSSYSVGLSYFIKSWIKIDTKLWQANLSI